MIITAIIPSRKWIDSAGVRIRYKRLYPYFDANNVELKIIPLEEVETPCIKHSDLIIICKIFEVDSIKIISLCHDLGIKVGVDLFDDYFSDPSLSVFSKQHDWLELAAKMCDFAICSTARMKAVASTFFDKQYIHQINDTKDPSISFDETIHLIKSKLDSLIRSNTLKILWFGIGDNPYFDVGIKDLNSYSNFLFQIGRICTPLTFTILTNERALTSENLSSISNLPIEARIEIWTEELEDNLLRESHIAFMPVSHQNFSVAKSTNRCLTALTYGCQVLSNGFNLYSEFSNLIYQSTDELINDCKPLNFRLNENSVQEFEKICNKSYDCATEVSKFVGFLRSNILSTQSSKQTQLSIIDFKPEASKLKETFGESQLIQIDGNRFDKVGSSNFWIEKIKGKHYFAITQYAYKLLNKAWKSHFLGTKDCDGNLLYRIAAKDLQKIMPENSQCIQYVLNYRYSQDHSVRVLNQIRKGILYSFIDHSFGTLIKSLFDREYIYLANNTRQTHFLRRL